MNDKIDDVSVWPRVCVYGTLKKYFRGHRFLEGAKYLGTIFVLGYAMRSIGGSFPAVFKTGRDQDRILGEVYELAGEPCKSTLSVLDKYEGVQSGMYRRETYKSGTVGDVFLYVQDIPDTSYEYVTDGVWRGPASSCRVISGGGLPPTYSGVSLTYDVIQANTHQKGGIVGDDVKQNETSQETKKPATPPTTAAALPAPVYADMRHLMGWEVEVLKRPSIIIAEEKKVHGL